MSCSLSLHLHEYRLCPVCIWFASGNADVFVVACGKQMGSNAIYTCAFTFLCHMPIDIPFIFRVERIGDGKILQRAKYTPDLLSTFPRDITDPGLLVVNLPL